MELLFVVVILSLIFTPMIMEKGKKEDEKDKEDTKKNMGGN